MIKMLIWTDNQDPDASHKFFLVLEILICIIIFFRQGLQLSKRRNRSWAMPKMENQPPNVVRVRLVMSGADPGLGLVLTSRHEPPRTAVRALQDGSEAKRCGLIHPGIEPLTCFKLRGGLTRCAPNESNSLSHYNDLTRLSIYLHGHYSPCNLVHRQFNSASSFQLIP